MIEPLRLSFDVKCPVDRAFAIWTSETARWWPTSHTVTGDKDLDVVFEGKVGGRIYERTRQGTEFDWGEVTVWDPPHRLGYLWHLRQDQANATSVEISFVDVGTNETRVDIEHSGWERLGEKGLEARDANRAGWGSLFPHFVAASSLPNQ